MEHFSDTGCGVVVVPTKPCGSVFSVLSRGKQCLFGGADPKLHVRVNLKIKRDLPGKLKFDWNSTSHQSGTEELQYST